MQQEKKLKTRIENNFPTQTVFKYSHLTQAAAN